MAEIKHVYTLESTPGVKRDGTSLDGNFYSEAQWVRFQRGKPKKIGGYAAVQALFSGPIRAALTWSDNRLTNLYTFSNSGIEMVQIDENGLGSVLLNRSVSGFTANENSIWSVGTMYDAAVGSTKTLVLALRTTSMRYIDDRNEYALSYGDALGTGAFADVTDVNAVASGGVFVTPPYAVLYGNDGKVTWSNQNEPQNYTTGDAGSARVTGAKLVRGLPMPAGSGPGGLRWSLDSVVRMEYIVGPSVFRFSTISSISSILFQSSSLYHSRSSGVYKPVATFFLTIL
jgi:hypothetical protein